jgi:hypothetical protein
VQYHSSSETESDASFSRGTFAPAFFFNRRKSYNYHRKLSLTQAHNCEVLAFDSWARFYWHVCILYLEDLFILYAFVYLIICDSYRAIFTVIV